MKNFITRIIASPFSYALAGVLTMCAMLLLRVYAHMGIEWCLLRNSFVTALVVTAAYMQAVYSGVSEVTGVRSAGRPYCCGCWWGSPLRWAGVGDLRHIWLD